jgi:hypothetical protein
MPNWCHNTLTLKHPDPTKLKEARAAIEKEKLLNYLMLMPTKLEGTTALSNGPNWYDWCCQHWGTKWDISGPIIDEDMSIDIDGEETLMVEFMTAWTPPLEAYDTAVKNGWSIHATYSEHGAGFVGEYYNGEDRRFQYRGEQHTISEAEIEKQMAERDEHAAGLVEWRHARRSENV